MADAVVSLASHRARLTSRRLLLPPAIVQLDSDLAALEERKSVAFQRMHRDGGLLALHDYSELLVEWRGLCARRARLAGERPCTEVTNG